MPPTFVIVSPVVGGYDAFIPLRPPTSGGELPPDTQTSFIEQVAPVPFSGSLSSRYLVSGTVPTPWLPYLSLSGTSQATPVVTGTVALMLQANPVLTPNAVKAILQYTAQP